MKKYAIYSAIIGDYDEIKQPAVTNEQFDYLLYSNCIQEQLVGIWQIRSIPYHNDIQTKIARYVKTHPEDLLKGYECSVWFDASIVINDNRVYDRIIELYNEGILIATMPHFDRHCIYDEMLAVIQYGFENEECVLKWGNYLRRNKYPRNNGLHETGVLYRMHSNKKIKEFDKEWWQYINLYSRRDQLSFDYVLWKHRLSCDYFFSDKENARNSDALSLDISHKNTQFKRVAQNSLILWDNTQYYKERVRQSIFYHIYKMPFTIISAKITAKCLRLFNAVYFRLKNRKHKK